jgi:hypothetical protein
MRKATKIAPLTRSPIRFLRLVQISLAFPSGTKDLRGVPRWCFNSSAGSQESVDEVGITNNKE